MSQETHEFKIRPTGERPEVEDAGFIAPQLKSSANGPWNWITGDIPSSSYFDWIFRYRITRDAREHVIYMRELIDSKGQSDSVLFGRVDSILRDVRVVPRWMTFFERRIRAFRTWYWRMKNERWPEFRKIVGF